MIDRRQLLSTLLAVGAAQASFATRAESTFPAKLLTLIVPYPSGGPGDLIARSIGEVMAERLGQPVVPDFRPGGGGQLAGNALLQQPADGHTLMLGDTTVLCSNKLLYPKFRYDPMTDFDPIAPLMQMPAVLYVPKSSPHNSLADVIKAGKEKGINYASQGNGSAGHLLGEMLAANTGGKFVHIAYKGSAPAMIDVMAGQVDILFDGIGAGLQYLKADRIKAIAVAHPRRLPQIPSVPTTAEVGQPDITFPIWFGAVAKAGTPAPILRRLNAEILYAMSQPKVNKRFTDLGFEFMSMGSDEFKDFITKETVRWRAFIKARRISIE